MSALGKTDSSALRSFDLVVIGGGPAGTAGAGTAAAFGHRVALVEQAEEVGGAGVISGTVPSKTLRETALALSGWRSRKLFGVDLSLRREATIADFTHHQQHVSTGESRRLATRLQALSVQRFRGVASFVNPHTVRVTRDDGTDLQLRGEKILIATGSIPFRPPGFAFEDDRVHDSDELLHLKVLPQRLAVIGAGVIGSEYACTFAAMGVEVHLLDGRDALLPFLDAEISQALAAAMRAGGIKFLWKEQVTHCDVSHPDGVLLMLSSGATLTCDGVLVCSGRSSNTAGLNLVAAGVVPGKRGVIPVGTHYRTEVDHIYAAGDVIGPPALAATSMEQARVAMSHAFAIPGKADLAALLPTGIYTIPEVSMVGATQEALQQQGVDFIVGRARYADNPRGRIIGDDTGFLKLLFRRNDMRLLGIHVIGEQATEVAHLGL
ncbi:MAG: Si-specific NAD(P)(+) transhydrogenase, partial [Steroidobacteraceae bacterium]